VKDCRCPVTRVYQSNISGIGNGVYEVQTDNYKCGPVAIINSLHLCNKNVGRSMRRYIVSACNTQQVHSDGFHGTRPENMNKVIMNIWYGSKRYEGIRDCIRAIKSSSHSKYIVLYSYFANNLQYFHYTVLFRPTKCKKFYTLNDGSDYEQKWTISTFVNEHLAIEGTVPIIYPQVWSII
jgi:hypothetical protein